MGNFWSSEESEPGSARMNFFDLANLLDNDGNLQNEMMVLSFAATLLATIPVLLGNEFDVNVGLRKKREIEDRSTSQSMGRIEDKNSEDDKYLHLKTSKSTKFFYAHKSLEV
ncbi:uncharacterized protein LOC111700111 [Eurytemora carolleeae]|uniref:uncharacterized protein LOC111700111 n=1 Tax=Eurytemora carolleeae TaxID=1294199 RepID=UPI000C75E8BC|nr:uncharacterized protein LOC111700111 [Eurytemora carolleeae]|eukprot:XP_023326699.1 uncharacterized protein LOC111700111 [Eurytemora affinis]